MKKLIAVLLIALSSAFAYAQEGREVLPGYKGFRFGMTEQEARQVSKLGPAIVEKARTRFKDPSPVTVDGVNYELSVTVAGGRLDTILLSSETMVSEYSCREDFQRVVTLVRTKYGAPDGPPNIKSGEILTTGRAAFTFRDGNSIRVSSFFIKKCLITVAYLTGKSGGSF